MPKERMKKLTLVLVTLILSLSGLQAQDTTAVKKALDGLERALVAGDTVTIKALLQEDAAFGHSSGWVQDRKAAVADMASGFLRYLSIDRHDLRIEQHGSRAIVKEHAAVKGVRDGKDFQVELFILWLWEKDKKGWRLVMRQSAKL
jgi:ketosteroid isomerase-like protein